MILNKKNWNENDYKKFINYLHNNSDQKYKEFHAKIVANEKSNILGIKTPQLKKIALEISKGNFQEFIKLNNHKYYEEIIIHGLIVSYLKDDFNKVINYFDQFLIYIDNWAICDVVCSNMKIFKKNQENGFTKINEYLNSQNNWYKRVGIVLLNAHYINDDYIDKILTICQKINSSDYYVLMANAWLISTCYIKYPLKTENLLKTKTLDKFTQNKAISKIRDSYRVNKINKDNLLKYKIK